MGNAKAVIYRRNAVERSAEALDQFMHKHPNHFIWSAVIFVAVSILYILATHFTDTEAGFTASVTESITQGSSEESSIQVVAQEQVVNPNALPNLDSTSVAPSKKTNNSTSPLSASINTPSSTKTVVKPGDSLGKILRGQGFSSQEIHEIAQVIRTAGGHVTIYPGEIFEFFMNKKTGQVDRFTTETPQHETLKVERTDEGFAFSITEQTTQSETHFREGTIQNSLFADASKAGLSDRVIMELAQLFQWEIDFALDIRQGDRFKVIYDDIYAGEEKIRTGPILAAEFVNNNKELRGFRFQHSDGTVGYYNEAGESLKKAFLKAPVDFARISSRFSLARKHPVLHKIRAHKGVDYAAPRGTPIKSTGRGRVTFAGWKGGYGRTVVIQHNEKHSTLYAHMNSFAKDLKTGQRVYQGQVIGTIGSTGLATGPHLHYEFRLNGQQVDPLKVKFPQAESLTGEEKQQFLTQIANLKVKLTNTDQVADLNQ